VLKKVVFWAKAQESSGETLFPELKLGAIEPDNSLIFSSTAPAFKPGERIFPPFFYGTLVPK
jgi:hypothetical protein